MPAITSIVSIILLLTVLVSCDAADGNRVTSLDTNGQKASYLIGYTSAERLKKQEVDIEIFIQGLRDYLEDKPNLIPDDQIGTILKEYQMAVQEKTKKQLEATALKNKQEGEAYLKKNAKVAGVKTTASGLQYRELSPATGTKKPKATNRIRAHYEGRLVNGTIFDSSYQRKEPSEFELNRVMPGWTEALQLMSEGAIWEISLPPSLAYGSNGSGQVIGPNSVLIFKVELIKANVTVEKAPPKPKGG